MITELKLNFKFFFIFSVFNHFLLFFSKLSTVAYSSTIFNYEDDYEKIK